MRTFSNLAGWTTAGVTALALMLGSSGCKSNNAPAPIVDANNGPDPAAANLAPVDPNAPGNTQGNTTQGTGSAPAARQPSGRVLGQRSYPDNQASGEQYPEQNQNQPQYQQQGQYPQQGYPQQGYGQQSAGDPNYDQYEQNVDAGQQALYADQAPPPLPEYQQPELTAPNDEWTPGYWYYGPQGYYWVPGAWVAPPYQGALWTPAYWGFVGGRYRFHHGFWARHVGFYGGIPYGYGYTGVGYEGGYWNGGSFFYNRNVNRVNVAVVRTVYERNVPVVNVNNRVSYNGPGGWQARPRPEELAVLHEQRIPPMQVQMHQVQEAGSNRQQFYAENHGHPAVVAVAAHLPADRTPPEPLRAQPAGQPVQGARPGQVGGFGQQGLQQRNEQAQQQQQLQQRQQQANQAQQNRLQQNQAQQDLERQQQANQRTQELQRTQQQNLQQQNLQQQNQQRQNLQRQQQTNAPRNQPAQPQTVQPQPQQQQRLQQQEQLRTQPNTQRQPTVQEQQQSNPLRQQQQQQVRTPQPQQQREVQPQREPAPAVQPQRETAPPQPRVQAPPPQPRTAPPPPQPRTAPPPPQPRTATPPPQPRTAPAPEPHAAPPAAHPAPAPANKPPVANGERPHSR